MVDFKVIDINYVPPNKPRICIVDDDVAIQSIIFDTLSDQYSLVSAKNGREGVQKIEISLPDLILMDVKMPDMGGYEAVRLLQQEADTKYIPVIMISAVDFDLTTVEMLKNEPNVKGFLNKPFRPKQLREIVKTYIRKVK